METLGAFALRGVLASQEPENDGNEPAHEPIYRRMCARYEVEHQKPATSWRRYSMYEEARIVALASSCQQKRQSRLPQRLVHQAVAAIDESCQKSSARKPWKKKKNMSQSDRLTNDMLRLAIKKKLPKKMKLGVIRATATVGCTADYFSRVWFGTVHFLLSS